MLFDPTLLCGAYPLTMVAFRVHQLAVQPMDFFCQLLDPFRCSIQPDDNGLSRGGRLPYARLLGAAVCGEFFCDGFQLLLQHLQVMDAVFSPLRVGYRSYKAACNNDPFFRSAVACAITVVVLSADCFAPMASCLETYSSRASS